MRAILFMDKDIAKIGKDRVIADNTRQSNLLVAIIQTEDQRVGKGALGTLAWTPHGPVSARKKITDRIQIKPLWISTDGELTLMNFKELWHDVSLSWVILSNS